MPTSCALPSASFQRICTTTYTCHHCSRTISSTATLDYFTTCSVFFSLLAFTHMYSSSISPFSQTCAHTLDFLSLPQLCFFSPLELLFMLDPCQHFSNVHILAMNGAELTTLQKAGDLVDEANAIEHNTLPKMTPMVGMTQSDFAVHGAYITPKDVIPPTAGLSTPTSPRPAHFCRLHLTLQIHLRLPHNPPRRTL
jgi:hypothetical protein